MCFSRMYTMCYRDIKAREMSMLTMTSQVTAESFPLHTIALQHPLGYICGATCSSAFPQAPIQSSPPDWRLAAWTHHPRALSACKGIADLCVSMLKKCVTIIRIHNETHTCTHVHAHMHTYTHLHAHTHTHTQPDTRTHARTHTQTDTHTLTHTHKHTDTDTHTHTHTRTHTHT